MNKKGQTGTGIFVGMMLGIMIFIALSQMLNPIKTTIETARSPDQLDCGNSSISIGTKATCVVVDWTMFGFVGAVLATIFGGIGGFVVQKIRTG